MRYAEIVTEGADAPLYHFTDLLTLPKILRSNCLGQGGHVSLSRDPRTPMFDGYPVKLTLDQRALRHRHRLTPHLGDWPLSAGEEDWWTGSEAEERVDRPIRPLARYLRGIEVRLDRLVYEDALELRDAPDLIEQCRGLAQALGVPLTTSGVMHKL